MNLKHFYYRGYFNLGIELSQPEKGSDRRKDNEKDNEKVFRIKNQILTSTSKVKPFSPAGLEKIGIVQTLHLRVQNPGLLPGIGYPHEVGYPGEFKLGFGFDYVTGLPVLPGSSVKGVLRSVFPQIKFNVENPREFSIQPDAKQEQKAKYIFGLLGRLNIDHLAAHKPEILKFVHALELAIFSGWQTDNFFQAAEKMVRRPMTKHDIFMDALPTSFAENKLLGRDALTPHGANPLKNPIPLPFVKVMPDVVFGFYFKLTETKIGNVTITTEHKRRIFAEILCTVGAGAKTNVGYGQFEAENLADRIPKPAGGAVIASQTSEFSLPVAQPTLLSAAVAARPRLLKFNNSLRREKVIGEVISVEKGVVRFRLPEVESFDGFVEEKVAASQLERFQVGKRFELTVSDVSVEKRRIIAKVSNFSPLP